MSESPTALRRAKEVQEQIHPRRALLREWGAGTGNLSRPMTRWNTLHRRLRGHQGARRRRQDAGRGRQGDENDAGRGRPAGERETMPSTSIDAKATRTRLRIRFES
jgi:hypothetical protein